jgi:hypothetical protein
MKTLVTIIILAASLLSASAQESTTYKISNFQSINISTVANVIISQGDYSVKAKHKLHEGEELKVEKTDNTLVIKTSNHNNKSKKDGKRHLDIFITVPDINTLTLSGVCNATVKNMKTGDLTIKNSGACKMEIENLECSNINLKTQGATKLNGRIKSKGHAELSFQGASKVNLYIQA